MPIPDASSTSSSERVARRAIDVARRASLVRRIATFALPCALTVGVVGGGAWALRDSLRLAPQFQSGVEALVSDLDRWRVGPPGGERAVIFGDSLTACGDGVTVGSALAARMNARGRPIDVGRAAFMGFRPVQYQYLLDDVLAGAPRLAIIQVNPALLDPGPPPPLRRATFLALSRKLSLARALRLRSTLTDEGLTLFDPFIYRVEAWLDLLYVVDGVQDRWQTAVNGASRRVSQLLDPRTPREDVRGWTRLVSEYRRERHSGRPEREAEVVALLGDTRRELRGAGARVVFYVGPIPPPDGQWRPAAEQRLAVQLDDLRQAVGAAHGEWLDLHALAVPRFHDVGGHLFPDGCDRVAAALEAAIVPPLEPLR